MSTSGDRTFLASLTSRVVAVILMVAASCAMMVGYATTTYSVSVFADGNAIPVETSVRNPQLIVAQADVEVGKNDKKEMSRIRENLKGVFSSEEDLRFHKVRQNKWN